MEEDRLYSTYLSKNIVSHERKIHREYAWGERARGELSVRSNSDSGEYPARRASPCRTQPLLAFSTRPFFLLSFLAQPPHLTLFTLTCRHERNEGHRRHGIMETTRRRRGGEYAGRGRGGGIITVPHPWCVILRSLFRLGDLLNAHMHVCTSETLQIEHGSSLQTMTRGEGELGRGETGIPGKPMTRCKSSVGFRIATISRTLRRRVRHVTNGPRLSYGWCIGFYVRSRKWCIGSAAWFGAERKRGGGGFDLSQTRFGLR